MKKLALVFILLVGGSVLLPSIAQNKDWHLTRYATTDGLASSDITTLFQDADHFLWIGHSAGVSRFDGYSFENLLFAGNHRIGRVYAIIEDKKQTIWIGAEGGLFFFRQNKLHYANTGNAHLSVYALALQESDSLWLGTEYGPALLSLLELQQKIEHQDGPATRLIIPTWKNRPFSNRVVKFISVANDGTVYLSNGYELFRYAVGKLTPVYTITENRDYITGIVGINKDTVYISSQLRGFWMISKKNIEQYTFSDGVGNYLARSGGSILYFANEGVYTFDPKTNKAVLAVELPDQYREWGSCVWRDTENNFWVGTHEELIYARPDLIHSIDLPLLEGFNELYSLYVNADGSMLAGGNRGRLFKRENNMQIFYTLNTVFPLAEVFDIYKTQNGDTWFCSGYEGISLLRNKKLTRYTTEDGLGSNGNYKFLSAPGEKLFVCGENGITQISYSNSEHVTFKNYYARDEYGHNFIVTGGIANVDGSLLLGSDHGLLKCLPDGKAGENDSLYSIPIENLESKNPSITGICKDNLGNLWLSTIGDGILLCTNEDGQWTLKKRFNMQEGLTSMIYLQILIDDNSKIWAIGYNDLVSITPKTGNKFFVKSYGQNHGFTSKSFHSAKMAQDKNGRIWVATSAGLMYFEPDALHLPYQIPVCKITLVSFPGKNNHTADNGQSHLSGKLSLPHHSSAVSFHFTAVRLSDPMAMQYAYRLLGADSGWVNLQNERTVTFQKLLPGNYTFQVKAFLGKDVTGNVESFAFKVLPPWWQRGGVLIISMLFLILSTIFIIRKREKNIKKREAEKIELEQFKTTSLQHQLEMEQITNFFATSLEGQKNIDEMLWDVAKNCISKLGFEDCVIYLKDEEKNVLIQKAAWGPKTTNDNKITRPIEIPLGRGIVGYVGNSGHPEIIADTNKDARYIVDDIERRSEISVPIKNGKSVLGVIDSEHMQKNFYTEYHLQTLTTIASLITDKIDKIRAEEKAREKEIEVLKLNRNLAVSQMTALRAQMNPHFIFNALNSVQQYILQGNVIEANKYLSNFSKLQREILNHCDQNFILLDKEMEMLDLYLKLEQLRFDGLFTYSIHLDDGIDADEISIPPMMVQPFVENAIWHGLMPKAENRKLDINFSLTTTDILLCTIKDNGIGREAASRLQKTYDNHFKHKSKGLRLVYERMDILKQQYQQPFDVNFTDLTDHQGNPQGTLVTLTIFAGD